MRHNRNFDFQLLSPLFKMHVLRGYQLLAWPPRYTWNNSVLALVIRTTPRCPYRKNAAFRMLLSLQQSNAVAFSGLRNARESCSLADDALHESCPLASLVTLVAARPDGCLVRL